ncbi:MAG: GNAT family N-acetyltransferase [Bacteroidetes bacterium]|nr:GNAT family N-acetyltransferase [Bacteroidota bacterium]
MSDHKTAGEELNIRRATESECGTILGFIRELGEYEKLLHEVVATEETLRKNIFERHMAEVIFAEVDGTPVGFALFFHNFSTFVGKPGIYLEDLYVKPQYRGKGYGKQLLIYLAKLAKQRDCGRFEWAVLDWNERAISFYRSLGAKPMNEWKVYRLAGNDLDELARQPLPTGQK